MNRKKLILIFFFSLCFFPIFSQNKGVELSDSVFDSLKKLKLHPYTQNLLYSGDNIFPYNVYVTFEPKVDSDETLLFIFNQEDYFSNSQSINQLIKFIKNSDYDFKIQLLFAYGENQIIKKDNMIFGDEVFCESLDYEESYTTAIFDLNADYDTIVTSSNGKTAPSWYIKNICELLRNTDFNFTLPAYYVSQQFRYKFYQDRQVNTFLSREIPAIRFNITKYTNQESIFNLFSGIIKSYAATENKTFDQHFLILNFFGKTISFQENLIVESIIFIIFIFIFFLVIFFEVNLKMQKSAWKEIRAIWYANPVTFLLLCAGGFVGKIVFAFTEKYFNDAAAIYELYSLELLAGFAFNIFFYLKLELNNTKFSERTIDYLIVISTFTNQFIFLFIDVSLFPIFMFICTLAILSILLKRNSLHIVLFVLMIMPYVFYAHLLINSAPLEDLKSYLTQSNQIIPILAFSFCPVFLMFLRILTGNRRKFGTRKALFIEANVFSVLILTLCILISTLRSNQVLNRNKKSDVMVLNSVYSDDIKIHTSDKSILNETVRTLKIKLGEDVEQCSVIIKGKSSNPVLYSDNSYINISQNEAEFLIPENPPENLIFSYGTDKKDSTILVKAIYSTDKKEEFLKKEKSVQLED